MRRGGTRSSRKYQAGNTEPSIRRVTPISSAGRRKGHGRLDRLSQSRASIVRVLERFAKGRAATGELGGKCITTTVELSAWIDRYRARTQREKRRRAACGRQAAALQRKAPTKKAGWKPALRNGKLAALRGLGQTRKTRRYKKTTKRKGTMFRLLPGIFDGARRKREKWRRARLRQAGRRTPKGCQR